MALKHVRLAIAALTVAAATGPVLAQTAAQQEPAALDPLARLSARVGYNSDHGALVGVGVQTDRLFGSHRLAFAAEAGDERLRYSLSYAAPHLFGENPVFGMRAMAAQGRTNDVLGFDSETIGVEPRLTWRLSDEATLSAYLGLSWAEISDVSPATSILIRNDAGTRAQQVFGLDLAVRRSDGPERLGYGVTVEAGRTDRDHGFAHLSGHLDAAFALGADGGVLVSASLRGGAIASLRGTTHVGDRVFLGPSSLRGFAFGGFGPRDLAVPGNPALGGNAYAVGQFDAQFAGWGGPERLVPGVFLDIGSLWALDDTAGGPTGADPVDDAFSLRASVGVRLDILTGAGPVTFSYARPIRREGHDRVQEFSLSFRRSF